MSSGTDGMPNVLLHHFKHNKVLHKQVVLLSIMTENVPFAIGNSIASTVARARPRLLPRDRARRLHAAARTSPRSSQRCEKHGLIVEPATRRYYLGRQTLLTTGKSRHGALAQDAVLVPRRATRARRRRSSACRRTASSSSGCRSSCSLANATPVAPRPRRSRRAGDSRRRPRSSATAGAPGRPRSSGAAPPRGRAA